jgi:hypothetical protein
MVLRTHNLHFGRLKNDFGEVDEAIFQGFERPFSASLGKKKAIWKKTLKRCFKEANGLAI